LIYSFHGPLRRAIDMENPERERKKNKRHASDWPNWSFTTSSFRRQNSCNCHDR
jgi:hypothetical protein